MMRSLIFALLFLLAIAVPTFACEPSRDPSGFTLEDYVNNAEFIFVGTVVSGESPNGDNTIRTATVEVSSYLKGEGSAVVEVAGFGYGPDCLSVVEIGDELIFFAVRASDGGLMAAYMSAHDAVAVATPERIADVQALTGQSIVPHGLPLDARFRGFLSQYRVLIGGIALGVSALGLALWFTKRNPGGKPKLKREEL